MQRIHLLGWRIKWASGRIRASWTQKKKGSIYQRQASDQSGQAGEGREGGRNELNTWGTGLTHIPLEFQRGVMKEHLELCAHSQTGGKTSTPNPRPANPTETMCNGNHRDKTADQGKPKTLRCQKQPEENKRTIGTLPLFSWGTMGAKHKDLSFHTSGPKEKELKELEETKQSLNSK